MVTAGAWMRPIAAAVAWSAGLQWRRDFYPHTHPIPIPIGIPTAALLLSLLFPSPLFSPSPPISIPFLFVSYPFPLTFWSPTFISFRGRDAVNMACCRFCCCSAQRRLDVLIFSIRLDCRNASNARAHYRRPVFAVDRLFLCGRGSTQTFLLF